MLGIRRYEAVLAPSSQRRCGALRLLRTVMFIGCGTGLNDPNLGALREFLARHPVRHRHFRLEPDNRCDEMGKEHAREGVSVSAYGENQGDLAPIPARTSGTGRARRKPAWKKAWNERVATAAQTARAASGATKRSRRWSGRC